MTISPFIKCSLKSFATLATQDGLAPRVSTTSWWWIFWVHHWTLTSSTVTWSLPAQDGTAGCENEGKWAALKLDDEFILILEMTQKSVLQKLRYVEDEQCGPSRDIGDESVRMFRCSLNLYNQYGWFLTHTYGVCASMCMIRTMYIIDIDIRMMMIMIIITMIMIMIIVVMMIVMIIMIIVIIIMNNNDYFIVIDDTNE